MGSGSYENMSVCECAVERVSGVQYAIKNTQERPQNTTYYMKCMIVLPSRCLLAHTVIIQVLFYLDEGPSVAQHGSVTSGVQGMFDTIQTLK